MSWEIIVKSPRELIVTPNLGDYEQAQAAFTWEKAHGEVDGLPGGRGT